MNDPVLLFTSLSSKVALFGSVQEQASWYRAANLVVRECESVHDSEQREFVRQRPRELVLAQVELLQVISQREVRWQRAN